MSICHSTSAPNTEQGQLLRADMCTRYFRGCCPGMPYIRRVSFWTSSWSTQWMSRCCTCLHTLLGPSPRWQNSFKMGVSLVALFERFA